MATKKTKTSKAAAPTKKAAPKKKVAPKAKPTVITPAAVPVFKTKQVTLKSDGTSVVLRFNSQGLWDEAKAMLDAAPSASQGFRTETPIKKLKTSGQIWAFRYVQGYEVK